MVIINSSASNISKCKQYKCVVDKYLNNDWTISTATYSWGKYHKGTSLMLGTYCDWFKIWVRCLKIKFK